MARGDARSAFATWPGNSSRRSTKIRPIPTPYNQWAWLVSNTEGDSRRRFAYSHRSLELIPADAGESAGASFLDTLGRCYYAAGDYENAVKYQRQAVEKVDYMQVMQRQLALFEKTLAEKQASRSSDARASSDRISERWLARRVSARMLALSGSSHATRRTLHRRTRLHRPRRRPARAVSSTASRSTTRCGTRRSKRSPSAAA